MGKTAAKKLCFVIGPIGKHKSDDRIHADVLLKGIIKPTFAKHFNNFRVERADHIAAPGIINSQVITNLIEADLVIADLTGRNANAFYELGIRHLLQLPVIHLYRRGDEIPADIAPYRAIEFSYEDKWEIRNTKIALRKMVTEAISKQFVIENPVTNSPGFIRLKGKNSQDFSKPPKGRQLKFVVPPASFVVKNAPGIFWSKKGDEWMAYWMADRDIVKKGYVPKGLRIWSGTEKNMNETVKNYIYDRANVLSADMHLWDGVIR